MATYSGKSDGGDRERAGDGATPENVDEYLNEYRHAEPGGHLVYARVLRALVRTIDELRDELGDRGQQR